MGLTSAVLAWGMQIFVSYGINADESVAGTALALALGFGTSGCIGILAICCYVASDTETKFSGSSQLLCFSALGQCCAVLPQSLVPQVSSSLHSTKRSHRYLVPWCHLAKC